MALRALAKASSPVSRWADAGAATAMETPAATKRFNRSGRLCMWYSPRLSVWDWCLDRDIPGASWFLRAAYGRPGHPGDRMKRFARLTTIGRASCRERVGQYV